MNPTPVVTDSCLSNLKMICRWSFALVWVWEGLAPKILAPTEMQLALIAHSNLYWPSIDGFLIILGSAMIVASIIICIIISRKGSIVAIENQLIRAGAHNRPLLRFRVTYSLKN